MTRHKFILSEATQVEIITLTDPKCMCTNGCIFSCNGTVSEQN